MRMSHLNFAMELLVVERQSTPLRPHFLPRAIRLTATSCPSTAIATATTTTTRAALDFRVTPVLPMRRRVLDMDMGMGMGTGTDMPRMGDVDTP